MNRALRRTGALLCVCAAALAVAGCGGRRGPPPDDRIVVGRNADGTPQTVRTGRDPNAAYIQAIALKDQGDCPGAIVLLKPVAGLGPGYETAQTALGECLLTQDDTREEGVTWLTRAADAGWPEAQFALAEYYSADSPAHDGVTAAYWLALFDNNPIQARIGFRPPDPTTVTRLHARLSAAEKEAGAKQAAGWTRKLWIPPTPSADQGLRPEVRGAPAPTRPE